MSGFEARLALPTTSYIGLYNVGYSLLEGIKGDRTD